ncbi:hypothetical protein G9C98_003278, partial [Cotesia typhae]
YGNEPSRIYGGENSKVGEFKFFVSFAKNGKHTCGGFIFDECHVITAAHCVANIQIDLNKTSIVSNITDLQIGGQEYPIERIIIHPNYDDSYPSSPDDIAILKMEQKIQLGDDQQKSAPARSIALASGPIESDLEEDICADTGNLRMSKYFKHELWDSQICTISPKGKSVCNGDSGGPLINDEGKVVGVVSYLVPCAQGYPDVYTNLAYFRDWILKTVTPN